MIHSPKPRPQACGYALVSAMLFLTVLSMIAVVMYRNGGTQNKIAGNTLEHQRSLQVAEGALRYAEWLLTQVPTPALSQNCNQILNLTVPGVLPVVCATPLLSPNVMPWSAGMLYQPLGMSVQAGGGVLPNHGDQTPPDIYYNQLPMMYIQRLGLDPNAPNRTLYRVTSAGFGGDAASVSVLQSVTSIGTGP